jgi:CHAD domain-containing protein
MAVNAADSATTSSAETEIKYEAAADAVLPSFDGLPQVARAEAAAHEQLDADYFDTDDLRLISAGITLRRRRGGHDAGWHLKLPAGSNTRREIRLPLGRSRQRVPAELARLVLVHTRGRELKPVARISTSRTRQLLFDSEGTSLAEVASDDVTAKAMGDAPKTTRWHEVELELTGGGRDLLDAADRLLRRGGLRRSGQSAKLARALDLPVTAPARQRPSGTSATVGDVLLGYLEAQVSALKADDPMVRTDEPDAVHQMRVTTRRLRSTLQSFPELFSKAQVGELITELRWLGEELGSARDAEVLAARLEERVAGLPAELVVGPVAARVRGHFARIGAEARAAMREALDSPRYFALLDSLDLLLEQPSDEGRPVLPASAVLPARVVLPRSVRRTYKRTRRRIKHAFGLPPGQPADAALHEARKAAKRARYAAEAVAPAFGGQARRFAKRMKKVQSVLGDHQDAVIARAAVRELGMTAHHGGENAFSYGVIWALEDQEAKRLSRAARRAWRSASRPRVRQWLR